MNTEENIKIDNENVLIKWLSKQWKLPKTQNAAKYTAILIFSSLISIYLYFSVKHSSIMDNIPVVIFTGFWISFLFKDLVDSSKVAPKLRNLIDICDYNIHNRKHPVAKFFLFFKWIFWISLAAFVSWVIIKDAINYPRNLLALVGMCVFVGICFLMSDRMHGIQWNLIVKGTILQCAMGLAVMRSKIVYDIITWIANQITGYLGHAKEGALFLFGPSYVDHEMIMGLVPVSVFFNATTYLLYHFGLLQIAIKFVGHCFACLLPASMVECFAAVSNIFFGPDATIMMVKPMIPTLSVSQLQCIISAGMASIDAGMIPIYGSLGVRFRQIT